MISKQPKQTLSAIALILFSAIVIVSCNNSADTSKAGTDSTKSDTSKMAAPADTTVKKVDTTKMDTAAKRPIKVTS
jgi:PBP1b-binding outer membrane lipoprotein LpoB